MIGRLSACTALCVLGTIIFVLARREQRALPPVVLTPLTATILSHAVRIDQERWDKHILSAQRVDTTIQRIDTDTPSSPQTVSVFFDDSDAAWRFALSHPQGTAATFNHTESIHGVEQIQWDSWWPLGHAQAMILAAVLVLAGLAVLVHWPSFSFSLNGRSGFLVIATAFFVVGAILACFLWPGVARSVISRSWTPIECPSFGIRTVSLGKTSRTELALRYTFAGQFYESIIPHDGRLLRSCPPPDSDASFSSSSSLISGLRAAPDQPWSVQQAPVWTSKIFFALFPMPFLLGSIIVGSASRSRQIKTTSSLRHPTDLPHYGVMPRMITFLLASAFLGIFSCLTVEIWSEAPVLRWGFAFVSVLCGALLFFFGVRLTSALVHR